MTRHRWREVLLEALDLGHPVIVSAVGTYHLGRSMSSSEYRSLLAAADRLAASGAVTKRYAIARDSTGRRSRRVVLERSHVAASEHAEAPVTRLHCDACGNDATRLSRYGDGPSVCLDCEAEAIRRLVADTSAMAS